MFFIAPNTYVRYGEAFVVNGNQYPANWLDVATEEEKNAIGIKPVVSVNSPKNQRYYWVTSETVGAEIRYTNVPKNIEECKIDDINDTKHQAQIRLAATDYVDVRNLRDPSYKPEVIAWRDAIRKQCKDRVAKINACTTLDELETLDPVLWGPAPL